MTTEVEEAARALGERLYVSFWERNGNEKPPPAFADQAAAIRSMWFAIAADALATLPSTGPSEEAVARIIDPRAFPPFAEEQRGPMRTPRAAEAFAKAAQIRDLFRPLPHVPTTPTQPSDVDREWDAGPFEALAADLSALSDRGDETR